MRAGKAICNPFVLNNSPGWEAPIQFGVGKLDIPTRRSSPREWRLRDLDAG
jgi:hypothetical protein